jgi:NAD(P)-dependent dehydrogenase (short-subunit alcohol dehydrogenase family)
LGHISTEQGLELESKLNSPNVCFVRCDVSSYQDQLALFATAKCRIGHVDIIIANAGITIAKEPFTPGANLEQEPSMTKVP